MSNRERKIMFDDHTIKSKTTVFLCVLIQWTWGVLQNLYGFAKFLYYRKNKHYRFRTAIVTIWDKPHSMGCGMFIFLRGTAYSGISKDDNAKLQYDTLVHEYGHTIQSMILGPLFVPVIAIPSLSWAFIPYFRKLRKRKRISYYWLYCERWANRIGDRICDNERLLK